MGADPLMKYYGEKEVRHDLEGEVVGAISFVDGDLHLTFGDGRWVRINVKAQYCDYAWLVLQGMDGDDVQWECEIYD